MKIDNYKPEYEAEVYGLIESFHDEYMSKIDPVIKETIVKENIRAFEGCNSKNLFLLVDEGKCHGIIAGIPMESKVSGAKIFQEIMFYIDHDYGKYCVWFIEKVMDLLRQGGFSNIVMAVLDSKKSERIEAIYKKMGFRYLETHFMRSL